MPPDGTKAAPKRRRSPARDQPAVALHPLRDWRTFVGEIGIVVIGVLLALGAEQVVSNLHNRSQVSAASEKLRGESVDNRRIVEYDLGVMRKWIASADRNIAALDGCRNPAIEELEPAPQDAIFLPGIVAWLGIRDGALLPLMPPRTVENYSKIDAMTGAYATRMADIRRALDRTAGAIEIVRAGGTDRQVCNEALLALSELRQISLNLAEFAAQYRAANELALRGERIDGTQPSPPR
jgi:hypothetical protein